MYIILRQVLLQDLAMQNKSGFPVVLPKRPE